MTPRIEITKKDKHVGIKITEVWRFYLLDSTLYLDEYIITRKEGRKTISVDTYSRLEHRRSNLEENEVPLTNEIKQEALDNFINSINVKTWSERNV